MSENLVHHSVMSEEMLDFLGGEDVKVFFDGTLGLGGHAKLILERIKDLDWYVGTDLDQQHLDFVTKQLKAWVKKFRPFRANFSELGEIVPSFLKDGKLSILLDLGVCSNHLDDGGKGFSFAAKGPLCMTFSGENKAEAWLNSASEKDLTLVFKRFGEEPASFKIARNIVESRKHQALHTTQDLAQVVRSSVPPHLAKKALTRVFQATRIEVNQELFHLEKALASAKEVMRSGDRLGVMSYHSLEDRIVKQTFKGWSSPVTKATNYSLHEVVAPPDFRLLTKKALEPRAQEVEFNPRSRSVRFRIVEKI